VPSPVNAKAIDDKPVSDKYFAAQAKTPGHFNFFRNPRSSTGAEECTGRKVCKLVFLPCRTHRTDALLQVPFCIIYSQGIILGCFHDTLTTREYLRNSIISFFGIVPGIHAGGGADTLYICPGYPVFSPLIFP
jgi:hypothetical protein